MSREAYPGTYRALVANANDPLGQQRVTLLIPQILGVTESAWAMPSTPTNIIPAPGDVVWVMFDAGDITAPIYTARGLLEISQQMADWVTGGSDVNTPPPPAGTPGVVGVLGGIKVSWDGLDTNGHAMPAYFHHMRVERDTVNTFPKPVVVASFTGAQTYYDSGVGYIVPYFYRLVPISKTNFPGTPTPSSPGVKALAAGRLDIGANSVTTNSFATGTFTATSGVIESLTADVISTGELDLTKGITIRSGTATPGNQARMTISTSGLNTWDASGRNTVSLSNTGSAVFTGLVTGSTIRATGIGDVSLTSTGHGIQVGPTTGFNIAMDNNEIQSRNNGAASTLALNATGGNVGLSGYGLAGAIYSNGVHVVRNDVNDSTLQIKTDYDNGYGFSQIRTWANEEINTASWNILAATIANNNTPNTIYKLRADGLGQTDGSWVGGGADFAEMFESADGTALPMGRAVTLNEDGKIRLAKPGDLVLGVTSGNPTVVGNSPLNWPNQFKRDVYGRHVLDEQGRRIPNPAWIPPPEDADDTVDHYVTRDLRDEWNAIGLIGQVVVDDDGTAKPGGWATVGSSDGSFAAAKTGYLVVRRVDPTHVVVLVTPPSPGA